jgi:hypothetical protein
MEYRFLNMSAIIHEIVDSEMKEKGKKPLSVGLGWRRSHTSAMTVELVVVFSLSFPWLHNTIGGTYRCS